MTGTATGPDCPHRAEWWQPRARLFLDGDGDLCIEGRENNLVACVARDDHVGEWNVMNPDVIEEIIRLWNDKPQPAAPTVAEAARVLLEAWEAGFGGDPGADKAAFWRLGLAASFGAQAFTVTPDPDAKPAAMIRALLQAIVDDASPDLDWLRACNSVRAMEAME